jgi:hypothetical protein
MELNNDGTGKAESLYHRVYNLCRGFVRVGLHNSLRARQSLSFSTHKKGKNRAKGWCRRLIQLRSGCIEVCILYMGFVREPT